MNEQTSQPRPVIGGTRKHMGVATSDPTYLPPVDNPNAPASDRKARVPVRKVSYGSGGSAQNGIPSGQSPSRIPVASPTLQVRTHEGGGNISPRRNLMVLLNFSIRRAICFVFLIQVFYIRKLR